MKNGKTLKSVLSIILALVMVMITMVPMVSAVSVDKDKFPEGTYVTSKTDYTIAPGITEAHITTNNASGSNQVAAFVIEVDLNNPSTSIIAGYKDYNGKTLGFQKVRDQAYAAESKRDLNVVAGVNADFFNMQTGETYGALVMNGTEYHSASGRPYFGITADGKAVIKTGKLTSDIVEAVGGLCLLVKDGSITQDVLTSDYGTYTAPRTAVGIKADGSVVIYVCDGRQAPYSAGQYFDEMAYELIALGCETALCLDGGGSTTFISQHEGSEELVCRNKPSDGSERTVASSLLVCSTAKPSGEFDHATLSPNNTIYTPNSKVQFTAIGVDSSGYAADLPADGTFALQDDSFGTITADGIFTSNGKTGEVVVNYISGGAVCGTVAIEVQIPDELYVANTEQAVGPLATTDFGIVAKYNDRAVTLKSDDIDWSITDQHDENDCYAFFYPDQFDEKYLTASTYGTYTSGGAKVNKASVTKLDWDCEYIVLKISALNPSKGTKYKIDYIITNKIKTATGLYQVTKEPDLNGIAGTFNGTTFTAAEDNAYNTNITATLKCAPSLTLNLTVFIGSKQSMLYDFEYVTGDENFDAENYIPSYSLPVYGKQWLADNGETNATISEKLYDEKMPLYMWPNGAIKNDTVSADIVSVADGEPVRFGDKALRISFDFSTYDKSQNGNFYLRVTEPTYKFEGSPTAIGVWVYAPEGTAPYHLYLNCGSNIFEGNATSYQCLTTTDNMGTETGGINWTGWRYLEFDLTSLKGRTGTSNVSPAYEPYGFYQSCGVFWISYQPANMGSDVTSDTIYIDDITLIYGANTSDTHNPNVTYIGDVNDSIIDGETVYTSNVNSFKAIYADVEDKYMTGINDEATKMYIDGVDVTDKCYINEGDDEIYFYDAVLADGVHNIEIEVADNFGNKTTEMRYFTIDSNSEDTEVTLTAKNGTPILGKDYVLTVESNNVSDVISADVTIKVLSDFTSYWRNVTVEPSANYELDGEAVYNSIKDTLSFKVVRKADAAVSNDDGIIAKIITAVPSNTPDELNVTHRIAKGELTYASEKEANYVNGFSAKISENCAAAFAITTDVMTVGAAGGNIYIKDVNGLPAEGVNVYTTDDELLGTTDAEGKVFTDKFVSEVAEFSLYATRGEERSFIYKSQAFSAGGDETGLPTNVILNASVDPATQQNISWMASPVTAAEKAIVKYATKAAYEADGEAAFAEFTGSSYLNTAAASGNVQTNYAVRMNTAVITGLTPNTEYVYIVGDGENWSPVKTFTTERKGTDTNFFVMGDMQSTDTSNVSAIFDQLAASGVDYNFGIQTGDAVDNAGSYAYWEAVGGAFSGEFISEIDMVHVMGNHEYTGDATGINAAHYFNLPGTTDEAPLAYSVEYGNVYVAVLDYLISADVQAAADWLVEDAANSTANWKILTLHQPPYFTNVGGGSTRAMMDILVDAIDTAGIDVVFSGHDHSYARSYPVTAGEQAADGTVYFICAATSPEKDYQISKVPGIHEITSSDYNSIYLTVSSTDTTFEVNVWDYDGENHNLFDSYTITKEVSCSENGHINNFDGTYLTCNVCGYAQKVGTYTGFVTNAESGKNMYLIAGNVQTGWVVVGEDNYLFDENGEAESGQVKYNGYTYTFGDDGKLVKGALIKNSDGSYSYYFNGNAQSGWFTIDGDLYYFSKAEGNKTLSGEWKLRDGLTYTFDKYGRLTKGAFLVTDIGTSYYWGPDPVTGLFEISGKTYYFDPANTYMVKNASVEIDGEVYSFDNDGEFVHFGPHTDADNDGKCDDCPRASFFTRIFESIANFFNRIIEFFRSLFS